MEGIISLKKFFHIWVKICEKNKYKIDKKWEGNYKEYTRLILKSKNSITSQIGEELGLKVFHEYYSIDAIYYLDDDLVISNPKNGTWKKTNDGIWLTSFRIVFEHENEPRGYRGVYQEICHLLTLKASLKVLVTYAEENTLDGFVEDINSSIPKNVLDDTPILLIVGYKKEKKYIWRGFSLKGKIGVEEI
jgi:hypothetical protein